MSVALSEHLPLLATAPDGIQKLRGLILELAVRGKLVPQDTNDDQHSWEHGLFSDYFSLEYGDNLPAPKRSGTGEYPVYGSNGVVGTHNECRVKAPCIVVGRKGSAGALNRCRGMGCWVTDVAYYCIPPSGIDLDFAFVLFQTLGLDNLGKGIKPGLSRNEAYSLSVAIPPLAEQHRIVAKVDELMALCDRLEAEQADAESAHARLVETLLGTLAQSAGAADLAANWQRLAEHFDTLFTTEASLDALKQTILQLAVMGKLVPQDPNDEPASELLKRIARERAQLEAGGKIKRSKQMPPVGEDEQAFALPLGWKWSRFSAYAIEVSTGPFGSMLHQSDYRPGGIPLVNPSHMIGGKVVPESHIAVDEAKASELSNYRLVCGDIVMARRGEVGRTALITEKENGWLCGTGSFVIRLAKDVSRPFIVTLFRASSIKRYLGAEAVGTTMVNLNHGILNSMPVAVPPLAEQHRIVAKVDELMALVDHLKAGLAESRAQQERLASTLIETALKAA